MTIQNPIYLVVGTNEQARFTSQATQPQRLTLTSGASRFVVDLPAAPLPLSPGQWRVLHQTVYQGQWRRGLGKKNSAGHAGFDDNPDGTGDNDFNDATITIENR